MFLLNRILKENADKDLDIHIIYDIACVLKLHFQVSLSLFHLMKQFLKVKPNFA